MKKIIILVGHANGKSTLTNFFTEGMNVIPYTNGRFSQKSMLSADYVVCHGDEKNLDQGFIKKIIGNEPIVIDIQHKNPEIIREYNTKFIFHVESEDSVPDWIKTRALIYKLDIVI